MNKQTQQPEPIALVGIGCRFPGGVRDLKSFWNLLAQSVNAITEIPTDRFDVARLYDARPATPGKVMTRYGGFLDQLDHFDPSAFGLAPREAERLDPQQRLLLETTWEALEDAGQTASQLAGSSTGVFTGIWLSDFEARLFDDPSQVDFYMTTGSGRYSASGRLSYTFGLQGPSLTVDTACSSSLVAVHLACQSLRAGECSMALAGAANVILQPHITIAYSQSQMMAPDGRCKFGDARANGYVRSEGAAVVVLKRLSNALANGDAIHALILGSAVNNDGQTSGYLTTPGSAGQEELLRKAYADAQVSPGKIQYVEAHGTGTAAGDPVEIGALGAVLAQGRASNQLCRIGSVKTNLGHTESAAGLAGLIKVVLAMQHRQIPASLHIQELNPHISWDTLPVQIQRELGTWQSDEPLLAGVSAFGIAGTNAHIVLQQAPITSSAPVNRRAAPHVLPISAHTPEALRARAQTYRDYLLADDASDLSDICFTASARRNHHDHRLALVADTRAQFAEQLDAWLRAVPAPASHTRKRKIVFVFPGQGSQWLGMGRQLLTREPAFRDVIAQCDRAIRQFADWSLLEQLESGSRLDEIDVIQPTLFAIEIALAALWRSWGIEPDAVIGHSMGEVAAAYVAGALNLDDAARVICRRSQLMKRVSGKGAMAMLELTLDETRAVLRGYENRLGIAVNASPRSTVISGDPDAVADLVATLQQRNVFCRLVKVDVAAHSPQMNPLRAELVASLATLQPQSPTIPIYSTVEPHQAVVFDAEYWGRNLCEPVLFSVATHRAIDDGLNTFIESSPHPVLLASIRELEREVLTLPSMRREENEQTVLLSSLGELYAHDYAVAWKRIYSDGRVVSLPTYPFQRERYWVEQANVRERNLVQSHTRLLGTHIESALEPGTHLWQVNASVSAFPYLTDHRVRASVVLPASAFVEMALEASQDVFGSSRHVVENVELVHALVLTEHSIETQFTLTRGLNGATFRVQSRAANDGTWTIHARGKISEATTSATLSPDSLATIRARTTSDVGEFYRTMAMRGLEYGAAFQGVVQCARGDDETLAQIQLPRALDHGAHQIHPAMLDACFQSLVATLRDEESPRVPFVPVRIEKLEMFASMREVVQVFAHAVRHRSNDGSLCGDVFLREANGDLLGVVIGLQLAPLERDELFYRIEWQPREKREQATPKFLDQNWLVFADENSATQSLAERLRVNGARCVLVTQGDAYHSIGDSHYQINPDQPADYDRLLLDAFGRAVCQGMVYAWAVSETDPLRVCTHALHLVQAIARNNLPGSPRLWLVTNHAQAVNDEAVNVAQSALWGLGATLAHELPELKCARVDLDAGSPAEISALVNELGANESVDQLALRGESSYVPRLVRYTPTLARRSSSSESYRIVSAQPGILDQLVARATPRRKPGSGEIEIEVRATGLNFMNVMSALGTYPGYPSGLGPLGIECAGVVTAVGEEVAHLRAGDAVMGVAFDCLGTHAITNARLVLPKPAEYRFEQAATIPIAFLTAWYAFDHLARLQKGERVLIHAATGGVGLAAIQIARQRGAEIFASAGSPEKRAYLAQLGVQHIFDSRSVSFADEVLAQTQGRGVDVVLNSLAGKAIHEGLRCLAPYGRFVEMGKRDIYADSRLGLLPFQKSLAYFAIDLDRMTRERPELMAQMFGEIMERFAAKKFAPLPLRAFPIAQVTDAFRTMAQARHVGKIVIVPGTASTNAPTMYAPSELDENATYLITGGTGGLGLAITEWMVARGARHLVLVSRNGADNLSADVRARLTGLNAQIVFARADVSQQIQVRELLAQIQTTMPRLRGVVHAAGILDDGVLLQQSPERFCAVFASKVQGAWHLHQLTQNLEFDFLILYSSITAVLGSPGQGNYAAANAYLDGLAHHRRALGLPALSINWGPWGEVGLAAQRDLQGLRGVTSISPAQGVQAFARALEADAAQAMVVSFDVDEWRHAHPAVADSTLFTLFAKTESSTQVTPSARTDASVRDVLAATESGRQRRALLESFVQEQAAQVLRLAATRIDLDKPLRTLGLDSLMSIEFRNRLERALGVSLSATLVFNYPTIAEIVTLLADKLNVVLEDKRDTSAPSNEVSAEVEKLSDAQAAELLAHELDEIDELLKRD